MKRILLTSILISIVILLSACNTEVNKEVSVHLYLEDYDTVISNDNITFEYMTSIGIDTEFTIDEIEVITSDFGVIPHETTLIDEKDFNDYIIFLNEFLNQISEEHIVDSNIQLTGLKPKVIFTLSTETSEIKISFYQTEDGEILTSDFRFLNNDDVDVFHYYDSDDDIQYDSINILLTD
ncbi:MAG: hypothetical protein K9L74_02480 [Candidatus Izimaplasma sp.]|nr:hypothetical protein [Candidatus Izimaplasma bacterium]